MDLAIIIIILIVVFFVGEKLLRKMLGIKKAKLTDPAAKNISRWGRIIIFVVALCFIPFTIMTGDIDSIFWFWMVYMSVSLLFEAYLQRKYIKESKEYVVTLSILLLTLCALSVISFGSW